MNAIKKRPLATGCGIYLLTVWAFLSFDQTQRFFLGFILLWSLLVSFLLSRILRRRQGLRFLSFLFAFALGGAAVTILAVDLPLLRMGDMAKDGELHEVRVECLEVGYQTEYAGEYRVRLLAADEKSVGGEMILICEHGMDLTRGDQLEISVKIEADGAREHVFSQEYRACAVLISEEAEYRFEAQGREGIPARLSRALRVKLEQALDRESAGLLNAFLLGNRTTLPSDIPLAFRNLGISHALAVSGLHLTLVLFGLEWVLKRLTVPRVMRDVAAIFGAIGYAMLVGAGASVLRAGGMLILTRLILRAERESDPPTVLGATLALIVTVSPFAAHDIGFQLSAAATAGILGVMPAVNDALKEKGTWWNERVGRIARASALSISALGATIFLSWLYFGRISAMTIPANLLLSLPITLCMGCGIGFLLLCHLPVIHQLAASAAEGSCRLLLSAVRLLDGGRSYLIAASEWVMGTAILVSLAVALLLYVRYRRCGMGWRRILPFLLLLCITLGGAQIENLYRARDTYVTFLSQNKDESFVVSSAHQTVLIDCSRGNYAPVQAALDAASMIHGKAMPNGYLLTHYHQRFIAAIGQLLRTVHLQTIYLPRAQTEDEDAIAASIRELAARRGTEVVVYEADGSEAIRIGEAEVRVYKQTISRSTHPTLRLTITASGRRIGYLGASAQESAGEGLADFLRACDRLYLGAHGPIIKVPLLECGEVICADEETAALLGTEASLCLGGYRDPDTVVIRGKGRNTAK